MSSFCAVRALRKAINNGSAPWKNSFGTSSWVAQANKKSSGSSSAGSGSSSKPPASSSASTGDLTQKVQEPPSSVFKKVEGPLGPGASKTSNYKNPEYFLYHEMTYAEMDVVMAKYRLPQPSSLKKPETGK